MYRVIHSSEDAPSAGFYTWSSCMQQYGDRVAKYIHTYSKTEAITKLYCTVQRKSYDPLSIEASLLALLTDRELLFPQTRERYYTSPKRSMKRAAARCDLVKLQADPRKSELNRILTYSKKAYKKREERFNEEYPLISLEKVQSAIRFLFADWDNPFSSFQVNSDDIGYCKSDLGKISYSKEPQKAEAIMSEWLRTVTLKFGSSDPIPAWDLLNETFSFSVVECFEFFSCILPECIWLEQLQNSAIDLLSTYKPSLAKVQKDEFVQQIKVFKKADLSCWKLALPALKQCLDPDFKRFEQEPYFEPILDSSDLQACASTLKHAMKEYLTSMETGSSSTKQPLNELAAYFLNSCSGTDETPLFLDQPHIIFQLFRSPLYRCIYQFEDRNWKMNRVIYNACVRYSLPITNQSLTADRKLFLAIIDICAKACAIMRIPFSKGPWVALWHCIEQSVQCLSFQIEDLFSVRHPMYPLLSFRDIGYPIFDVWIKQKLSEQHTPVYIAHWRSLIYKLCNPSRKQTNTLEQSIFTYRSLFESPTADENAVWRCLEPIATLISKNKIKAAPTEAEIKAIAKRKNVAVVLRTIGEDGQTPQGPVIHLRARKGPLPLMKSGSMSSKDTIRMVDMIHTEWLLLQCVCGQAQRELMETIYMFLTETKKDPA